MLFLSVEPLNKGQFGFRQFLIRLEVPIGWMLSFVGGDNFWFLHMSFPIGASYYEYCGTVITRARKRAG